MTTHERENIEKLAEKAKKWIESDKGEGKVKKALQNAKELTAQFNKARQIDSKSLQDPVTL